jgi:glycosyltransferase involved in cell wall biosynthesis
MLGQIQFPLDVRVYKEARSLIRQGHEVHLICLRGKGKNPAEYEKIKIHRMPFSESSLKSPLNWLVDYALYSIFSPVYVYYYVLKLNPKVLHIHNPPDFSVPCLLPLRLLGKKIIFDVHDPTPLLAMTRLGKTERNPLIMSLNFFFALAIKSSNHVITVSDLLADLIRKHGKEAVVVRNCPPEEFLEQRVPFNEKSDTVIYLGAMIPKRGLSMLMDSMELVRQEIPNAELLMVGAGDIYEQLKEYAKTNNLNFVKFTGKVHFMQVPRYLGKAAVAVVPFEPSPINNVGSPNKLYEYMGLGRAIVCVDLPGTRAIGKDAVEFVEFSREDMARGITKLLKNKGYAKKLSGRAVKTAGKKYTWENEEKTLLKLYGTIEKS